jgi:hypothetical protein
MAGLLSTDAPQYVTPGGTALVTKTQGGMFGLFPGTPEYTRPEVVPAAPPTTPPGNAPVLVMEPAEIEVRVRIPGVAAVQGQVTVAPAVVAALVPHLVRLAGELGKREVGGEVPPAAGEPADDASDTPEASARRSEVEQRVWDRD